ncbi:MAG: ABC transporter substrate-binding protein [bacterium]|nr:ABC transporter substrate-binding protein [bacterium]
MPSLKRDGTTHSRDLSTWIGVVLEQSIQAGNCAFGQWRRFISLSTFALAVLVLLTLQCFDAAATDGVQEIPVAYLSQIVERPPKLSNLDLPPDDEGFAGGRLSVIDSNVTGQFLKQEFVLREVSVPVGGDAIAAFNELINDGYQYIILNVSADRLLEMAGAVRERDVLLFNAGAPDDRLRGADCRDNVLHILPSRSMLSDALAQYLIWKKWPEWFLVTGQRPRDREFADAVRRSARKFGGKIVEEKAWDYGPDARRTAQSEVPVFSQGVDYDVLVVADEIGEFGEYLAYRTWEPRPVTGTQGLVPTSWHRTHEQWGAAQLQSRFFKTFGRYMTPLDYHVWAPIRSLGEGAARTNSTEFRSIVDYIRSDEFNLAGFKGQKLTFRKWNWQLRQPILLTAARALVSVSPQPGFLHQGSLLDTLGLDEPESDCRRGE